MWPTVAALTFAFGAVACGGNDKAAEEGAARKQAAAARREAEPRYRVRFTAWSAAALQPALRVSGIFANPSSLDLLMSGDVTTRQQLDVELRKLRGCSKTVERIGKPPARFRPARATAMNACAHFEAGAALLDVGLGAAQGGLGPGLLSEAAGELTKGTQLVGTATNRLPAP
jgi:hypothetical protein